MKRILVLSAVVVLVLALGTSALAVPSADAMALVQIAETSVEVNSLLLVATFVGGLALIGGGFVLRRKNPIAA